MLKRRGRQRMIFEGVAASSGIGIGEVLVINRPDASVAEREIDASEVDLEIERFRQAVETTRREILAIKERFARERGAENSRILETHLLILKDTMAIDDTEEAVRRERKNVDFLFERTMKQVEESLAATADTYLAERVADLRDVRRRVIRALRGEERVRLSDLPRPAVIVAPDLYPGDTAQMQPGQVLAMATDLGGRTSHSAILARQLEIPAVVGLGSFSREAETGCVAIVDGNHGRVILNPSPEDISHHEKERERFLSFTRELLSLTDLPAVTVDGREIPLAANVGLPHEVDAARRHGARGIGLFRTEFIFLGRENVPGEEEQYHVYRRVVEAMRPDPVVVRTLDLGGEKISPGLWGKEFLASIEGYRGVRLSLARPDLFRTQLRAIFRAAAHGLVRVMFPMVAGVDELRDATEFARGVANELLREGQDIPGNVEIGSMIETPAAAVMAIELGREADFFSIGTNDLVQYTLAVDRTDEKMAHLFEPLHPAVLRLIRRVVEAGREVGIRVTVCGEMSADPLSTLLLVGLGVNELSVGAAVIPEIKRIVRSVSYEEACRFADNCLSLATTREVRARAKAELDAKFWGSMSAPEGI